MVQLSEPETWNAFLRRIHKVEEVKKPSPPPISPMEQSSIDGFIELDDKEYVPF